MRLEDWFHVLSESGQEYFMSEGSKNEGREIFIPNYGGTAIVPTTWETTVAYTFTPKPKHTKCAYCHSKVSTDESNCPRCGAPLGDA